MGRLGRGFVVTLMRHCGVGIRFALGRWTGEGRLEIAGAPGSGLATTWLWPWGRDGGRERRVRLEGPRSD